MSLWDTQSNSRKGSFSASSAISAVNGYFSEGAQALYWAPESDAIRFRIWD